MLVAAAIGGAAALLGISSARNMLQTNQMILQHQQHDMMQVDNNLSTTTISSVEDLHSMSRRELVALFQSSDKASLLSKDDLEGEWDGHLLNNNSWIMTKISSLLTHVFFGLGSTWNGKRFHANGTTGTNRFIPLSLPFTKRKQQKDTDVSIRQFHGFQYKLDACSFVSPQHTQGNDNDDGLCWKLVYSNHSPPWSLWHTMVDELRPLTIVSQNPKQQRQVDVLLGMGYMAWSGGHWNAAPFYLVRKRK